MYSATLGLVDIVRGTNSYYKLQLLEDDVQKRWVASFSTGLKNIPGKEVSHDLVSVCAIASSNMNPFAHAGTGCSGRGAEWAPPSEATSWTSSVTRTPPWTASWTSTKRRLVTSGAPPISPNIPTNSTPWRSTMDRYRCRQHDYVFSSVCRFSSLWIL